MPLVCSLEAAQQRCLAQLFLSGLIVARPASNLGSQNMFSYDYSSASRIPICHPERSE
jgi:hypothetical protein